MEPGASPQSLGRSASPACTQRPAVSVRGYDSRLRVVLRAQSGFSTDTESTEVASDCVFVRDLTRDLSYWNNLYRIGDSVYLGLVSLASQLAWIPEDDTERKTAPEDGDAWRIWPRRTGC